MKRKQVSAYGVVAATLLSFFGTTGYHLVPNKFEAIWLGLFAASFITLYFAVDVPEAGKQDEKG
jgi:hypothetical protein